MRCTCHSVAWSLEIHSIGMRFARADKLGQTVAIRDSVPCLERRSCMLTESDLICWYLPCTRQYSEDILAGCKDEIAEVISKPRPYIPQSSYVSRVIKSQ